MSNESSQEFSKLRSFFWPIYNFELKKFLPLVAMFFCITFNYAILRDTKDSLVVTAAGAEAIPFLKLYGVVPAAILFTMIYAKLSNILSKEKLFYAAILPFIAFFTLFATVLYPLREALEPTTLANYMENHLPGGYVALASCVRTWSYSIFYIFSELWGSVALSLLFWGFVNDIVKVDEAKRFYPALLLGANIGQSSGGYLIYFFSSIRGSVPEGVDAWQVTLNYLIGMFFVSSMIVLGTYFWMQRNVMTDKRFYDPTQVKKKKSKPKLGMVESIKFLMSSKYIRCIAMLVFAYGICINLVEVTWKSQLKLQFPQPNDYSAFMGLLSFYNGIATIGLLFISSYVLRRKGWGFTAMVTPTVLALTAVLFFSFVIFRDGFASTIQTWGTTPLYLAVVIGLIQNVMTKSSKYAFFDTTKEMAYIPLDQESKVKGKAAIDVVGARLGKSGGGVVYQILFLFGTIATITPYVAALVGIIIAGWMYSVASLNRQFVTLSNEKVEESKAKEPQAQPAS